MKPSLSNPSLPYKMGKEKSVRNDNKEQQKTAKNLMKKHIFLVTKTKQPSSFQARFYIEKKQWLTKTFLLAIDPIYYDPTIFSTDN